MTAVLAQSPGGPEVLETLEFPVPKPGQGEILIQVVAAGVNRVDILQRKGFYPPPEGVSNILGLEIAGEVVACANDDARFKVGDRVCALVPGGGYSQYCVASSSVTLPIPADLTWIEAAAVPETYFTVWHNVFQRGRLAPGETFLVHGGSSGIGTTAIQLARAFGAKVIATAGSDEKCAACRDLGAHLAINYRTTDFVSAVKDYTDNRGVNVILDMVGGSYVERNHKVAANEGRIVQIAFLDGASAKLDLAALIRKRLVHTGSTLRARSVAFKTALAEEVEHHIWPLLAAGKVGPVIDSTFPLSKAARAHERMQTSAHIGKIVLTLNDRCR